MGYRVSRQDNNIADARKIDFPTCTWVRIEKMRKQEEKGLLGNEIICLQRVTEIYRLKRYIQFDRLTHRLLGSLFSSFSFLLCFVAGTRMPGRINRSLQVRIDQAYLVWRRTSGRTTQASEMKRRGL